MAPVTSDMIFKKEVETKSRQQQTASSLLSQNKF